MQAQVIEPSIKLKREQLRVRLVDAGQCRHRVILAAHRSMLGRREHVLHEYADKVRGLELITDRFIERHVGIVPGARRLEYDAMHHLMRECARSTSVRCIFGEILRGKRNACIRVSKVRIDVRRDDDACTSGQCEDDGTHRIAFHHAKRVFDGFSPGCLGHRREALQAAAREELDCGRIGRWRRVVPAERAVPFDRHRRDRCHTGLRCRHRAAVNQTANEKFPASALHHVGVGHDVANAIGAAARRVGDANAHFLRHAPNTNGHRLVDRAELNAAGSIPNRIHRATMRYINKVSHSSFLQKTE